MKLEIDINNAGHALHAAVTVEGAPLMEATIKGGECRQVFINDPSGFMLATVMLCAPTMEQSREIILAS